MTARQKYIRDFLAKHCQGHHHGMDYHDLELSFAIMQEECVKRIQRRQLRQAIHDLVMTGCPIGTTRKHGVFWCVSEEDYKMAIGNLYDEALPTLLRLRTLKHTQEQLATLPLLP